MEDSIDIRRKKLLYQASYRGFKEADLLIGGFARAHLPEMTPAELDEFEALLGLGDSELYAWAVGNAEPPANVSGPVFQKLRSFTITPA